MINQLRCIVCNTQGAMWHGDLLICPDGCETGDGYSRTIEVDGLVTVSVVTS